MEFERPCAASCRGTRLGPHHKRGVLCGGNTVALRGVVFLPDWHYGGIVVSYDLGRFGLALAWPIRP